MKQIAHPSNKLSASFTKLIRQEAAIAEENGKLTDEQLALVFNQKWLKTLVPNSYSGLQLSIPEVVRLEESIAWADGSLGWVVTLCSGAGWFSGFLTEELTTSIFTNDKVCLAGSGAATGTAEKTQNGYLINGNWTHASGIHHATHVTANCIIIENGKTVLDEMDSPLVKAFIFDKQDVQIIPTWKHMGMIATKSDSYAVNNLHVNKDRCFSIHPEERVNQHPLYLYPFKSLADITLSANLSGIAIHFIDICRDVFAQKIKRSGTPISNKTLIDTLSICTTTLENKRNEFYTLVDSSWDILLKKNSLTSIEIKNITQISHELAQTSRECVDRLYPYCGLAAAQTSSELNRAWRDLHTASQHSLLTFPTY